MISIKKLLNTKVNLFLSIPAKIIERMNSSGLWTGVKSPYVISQISSNVVFQYDEKYRIYPKN